MSTKPHNLIQEDDRNTKAGHKPSPSRSAEQGKIIVTAWAICTAFLYEKQRQFTHLGCWYTPAERKGNSIIRQGVGLAGSEFCFHLQPAKSWLSPDFRLQSLPLAAKWRILWRDVCKGPSAVPRASLIRPSLQLLGVMGQILYGKCWKE